MKRRYRLTKHDRLLVLTFALAEGAVESGRSFCRSCGIPIARAKAGRVITLINVDGTPHRASCASTYRRRASSIRDWEFDTERERAIR